MNKCLTCQLLIPPERKFCSKSCSAKHNNIGVRRHGKPKNFCKQCQKETKTSAQIFCSNRCQSDHGWNKIVNKILNNEHVYWKSIRKYLLIVSPHCSVCGIKTWHDLPISLECDHIDGDISNNVLLNARLLCPNCHSQTETFRVKNKDNPKGKDKRKLRYKKVANQAGLEPAFSAPITINRVET